MHHTKWPQRVMEKSRARGTARLLLMVLAIKSDSSGLVRVSSKDLAQYCKCAVRLIHYDMAKLLAFREIKVKRTSGGRGNLTVYRLMVRRLDEDLNCATGCTLSLCGS